MRHVLVALDAMSGAVRWSRGVDLAGDEPSTHQQRAALALGNGYVYVENRGEIYQVQLGAPLPGLGPVQSVKRQDGRWIVLTPKGIIVSLRDRRSESAHRLLAEISGQPAAQPLPGQRAAVRFEGLAAAAAVCAKAFLADDELPWRWRTFLFIWFVGRLLAAKGYLAWLERRAPIS
jgi:hypothetical protein